MGERKVKIFHGLAPVSSFKFQCLWRFRGFAVSKFLGFYGFAVSGFKVQKFNDSAPERQSKGGFVAKAVSGFNG